MNEYFRVYAFLKPYWLRLAIASFSAALYSAFSAALIWMFGPLLLTLFNVGGSASFGPVDDPTISVGFLAGIKDALQGGVENIVSAPTPNETLLNFCILIVVVTLCKNGFNYLQCFLMAFVQQAVTRDVRNNLFKKYQELSVDYFHRERTGAVMSRVTNDVTALNETLDAAFNHFVADIAMVFFLALFLIVLSWKLTLLAAVSLPVLLWFIYFIGKKIRVYSGRSQERMADVTAVLEENVSNIRLVKAFGGEGKEISKFQSATERYFRELLKMTRVNRLSSPTNDTLASLVGVVVLFFAGGRVMSGTGDLNAADFMVFILAIFSLIKPAKSLSQAHARMQQGIAAAVRIFETLDTPPRIVDDPKGISIPDFQRAIEYRSVTFSYNPGEPVLKQVSFAVRKGEVVALVGPSGGGKSTIVDLLSRFYDPKTGGVFIDGHDLRALSLASLRNLMGIVTQETYLFNDTIAANISFGLDGASEEQITAAATTANAHEFILQCPEGYRTVVGNRGIRLSGGQRQRIAIARALLRNPSILIFDEATSALDTQSEHLVQGAINNLLRDRTVIVVAHRLSTIRHADRILVIDDGRIVEEGMHEELLARSGLYHTLYRLQFHEELLPNPRRSDDT